MIRVCLFVLLLVLAFPTQIQAVCPVCTVAVAGGIGVSRWLGIDDSITGIWIGGLIISSGLWLASWIEKRKLTIPQAKIFAVALAFLFVIPPLYLLKMIGLPGNSLLGVDKVIFGTIIGSILFLVGVWLDKLLRITNGGSVYIYYQKVIAPVLLLTIGSFVLFIVTS